MIYNTKEEENWQDLLETPPEWRFSVSKIDKETSYTEEELLSVLQPSTFDFMKEDEEDQKTKENKKKIEERQKKAYEHGTYVLKMPNFVADSIKFEYTFNEVASRCIMISNISEFATKEDLQFIFDSFGPQETSDLTNINKGIASVVFYSMEDAQAMRVSTIYLCNKQIIKIFHQENETNYKVPKNNGTIVIFRIPSDIQDEELYKIFSKFGKIRQIRSTPNKASQKFIEYYDIRSADKALKRYNGKPLNKKSNSKVSIEFSHPSMKKNVQKFYKNTLPTIERNNKNNKNNNKILY